MIIGILIIFLHKFCNRKLFNSSHTIKKYHFFSPPFWKHPFFSSECSRNVPATFSQKRLASCHGSTPAGFSLLKGLEVLSGEWSISKADPLHVDAFPLSSWLAMAPAAPRKAASDFNWGLLSQRAPATLLVHFFGSNVLWSVVSCAQEGT